MQLREARVPTFPVRGSHAGRQASMGQLDDRFVAVGGEQNLDR